MGQSVLLEAVRGFSCAIVDHMKSYIAVPPDVLLAAAFCKGAAASFVLCCLFAVGGRLLPRAFSLFHYRAGLGTLQHHFERHSHVTRWRPDWLAGVVGFELRNPSGLFPLLP